MKNKGIRRFFHYFILFFLKKKIDVRKNQLCVHMCVCFYVYITFPEYSLLNRIKIPQRKVINKHMTSSCKLQICPGYENPSELLNLQKEE